MALTFVTFPPSPTRPTHIATTHVVLTPQMRSRCCNRHAWNSHVCTWMSFVVVLVHSVTGDKMKPWGMFWRCYAHPVGVCPSVDHVSGCVSRRSLSPSPTPSPSLSLWDFLYEKNNNEQAILKSKGNESSFKTHQRSHIYSVGCIKRI